MTELRAAVDVLANAPSSPAPVKVEVESAGKCVGSFAHVWINGEEAGHLAVGWCFLIGGCWKKGKISRQTLTRGRVWVLRHRVV